jgi:TPR repeat protein
MEVDGEIRRVPAYNDMPVFYCEMENDGISLIGYFFPLAKLKQSPTCMSNISHFCRVSQFDSPEEIGLESDCLPSFVSKGIAMACFYYARCLHLGHGVKRNDGQAKQFYSKVYNAYILLKTRHSYMY